MRSVRGGTTRHAGDCEISVVQLCLEWQVENSRTFQCKQQQQFGMNGLLVWRVSWFVGKTLEFTNSAKTLRNTSVYNLTEIFGRTSVEETLEDLIHINIGRGNIGRLHKYITKLNKSFSVKTAKNINPSFSENAFQRCTLTQ